MTSKIKSLNDVFLEELSDLYSAENQLVKAIPKMVQAATTPELKTALEQHLEETKNHVSRLKQIFTDLGEKPGPTVCKGMKGLIAEEEDVVKRSQKSAARDAAVIGAIQRVEHYEIAAYGTARSHASLLGKQQAERLLEETLTEEKEADEKLNEMAEGSINSEAKQLVGAAA